MLYNYFLAMKNKLLLFFVLFLIIGCNKKKYEVSVERYLNFIKNNQIEKAYNLLSKKDKEQLSINNFKSTQDLSPIGKYISKNIKYRIIESSFSNTKLAANVKVEIQKIDLLSLYDSIPELLKVNLTEKQINNIFLKNSYIIRNNIITQTVNYKVVFENNDWFIVADYGRQNKLNQLYKIASDYYNNYEYPLAIKTYENILDFNNSSDVINKIIKIEEKLNYINKFLNFSWTIKNSGKDSIELNIKIKNTGTIVVKKIFVRLTFFNEKNQLVSDTSKIDQSLDFNEEKNFTLQFNNIKIKYKKVECKIAGIDWE